MPELPEVETVRLGLAAAVAGRRIESVWSSGLPLNRPLPEGFGRRVAGRTVEALDRRGKVLLLRLSGGGAVLIHLGMSGRVAIGPEAPPVRHDHLRLTFAGGVCATLHDPRRFGFVDFREDADLAADPLLSRLGPEPLADDFTATVLAERLAGRKGPVKTVLLDQTAVAGLGNIYVCEALFRARISPVRAAGKLGTKRLERLVAAIREVLAEAVAAGGSSLRDHRLTDGSSGYFQLRHAVYGRAGEPCPVPGCGQAIKRIVQSGRSTYYCPGCQH
jgi:formamidopyrimidine-DNA glycosylase